MILNSRQLREKQELLDTGQYHPYKCLYKVKIALDMHVALLLFSTTFNQFQPLSYAKTASAASAASYASSASSALICQGLPWSALLCHGLLWSAKVYHYLPWSALVCFLPKLHFPQKCSFQWALAKWNLCRRLDGLVSDLPLIRVVSFCWETQP